MKTLAAILPLVAVVCFVPTLHAAPPRVVEVVPEQGSKEVDPNLKELRIVFDQPMRAGSLSVVGGGPTFPKFVGTHRWVNDRTFVWAWQLGHGGVRRVPARWVMEC